MSTRTRTILTDLTPLALARAIEESEIAYWEYRARVSGWELRDDAGLTIYCSGLRDTYFNGVLRTTLAEDTADQRIAEALAYFRERRLPGTWWLGPSRTPAGLGKRLARFGLIWGGDDPGMAADLSVLRDDVPLPASLRVERVRDERALRLWRQTWRRGNGLDDGDVATAPLDLIAPAGYDDGDPLRFYLAWLDDKPVAVSQLLLAAGVAGLYNIATLPRARRRGIGAAATLVALREARALGYRVGVLGASMLGYPMYQRLGFQTYCTLSTYTWHAV